MSPHLAGIRGPLTGRTFALGDQPLTIGRAADNTVVIASPRASRHHAHIRREGASFVLYDLGSANGTLVNGQRVQRAVLQPGDLIDIGDEVFRFEAGYQQDATLLSAPQAPPPAYPSQPQPSPYPPQAQPPAYPPQPQAPPPAYPPQLQAQPQMRPPAPPYPPQSAASSYPQQTPAQGYPGYGPPAGHPPMYAPPPPRARSGGRACLLMIVLMLTLVCVAGAAGAFVFRDRLRDIPGIGDLPGIGGNPSGIAPPPVQTGSATVGSGQAAAISMPNGPMIEVPHGAVPPNPDGTPGTLTFSIAPAPDQPVSLPDEMALSGPLYQFEPEGVTFAVPVRITLPIPADADPARVMGLVTRDAQSGEWVTIAGVVDAAARTVSAEVTHFSPFGVYSYTGNDPDAWRRKNGGWFVLEHPGVRGDKYYPTCRQLPRALYLNVCIQSATLTDPSLSSMLRPNAFALGQSYSYSDRREPLKVWLPAGTYRVVHAIEMSEINNDPLYVPCHGWWVKPPQVINLQPGQTVTFARFEPEDGVYMDLFNPGTCTGTPAAPLATTGPSVTPLPALTDATPSPTQSSATSPSATPTLVQTPTLNPTAETPSICTQEVELINNRYLGACGMSDTQTFDLASSVFVTRIRVWHYPLKTGTDTPYVTITGPNGYLFSGNTTKGDCYAGWCEAMVTLNQNLSPGTYTLSIPTASICTDPSGMTTLILYGCSGSG